MDITGLGSIADFAGGLLDRFFPKKMTEAEKKELQSKLATAIEERDVQRDSLKTEIMKAELSQGDNYTKRARPTVVYMGLLFIFLVHVIFPMIAFFKNAAMPTLSLPPEFWYTWGGVCSVWMIGRTMERTGAASNIIQAITGSKK
ncbi:MAG: hypothetical protein GXP56_10420 [Deltaproteobacteria bacterium]|nr:hypothetical protein [Deltaproteobacteria bacterium]